MSTRLLARIAGVLLLVAGLLGFGPALPSHAAACSGTTGVTIVVDFGSSVTTACAPGRYSSGLAALQAAGFSATRASAQPGYFLCRINGVPSSDPCVRASPISAYWSIWSAARGGSWSYTQAGVASYVPAAGSVLGFHFGATAAPRIAPPAKTAAPAPVVSSTSHAATPPAPRPAPAPRPSASASSTSAGGAQGAPPVRTTSGSTSAPSSAAGRPSATQPSAATSSTTYSASSSTPTHTTSTSGATAASKSVSTSPASTGAASATDVAAGASAHDTASSGHAGLWWAAGAAVVVLGAGGVVLARLRDTR